MATDVLPLFEGRVLAFDQDAAQRERNMDQSRILAPFLSMMMLTLIVWAYMYARRIPFILKSNLSPDQLAPIEFARISPPAVSNPSDNLKNLFEIPTIFYALVLLLFVTRQVDGAYLAASWVFVVFRVLHSAVHCTINVIVVRFWLYFASSLAVWFMAIRAALRAFG
jgi:hypothetical protein